MFDRVLNTPVNMFHSNDSLAKISQKRLKCFSILVKTADGNSWNLIFSYILINSIAYWEVHNNGTTSQSKNLMQYIIWWRAAKSYIKKSLQIPAKHLEEAFRKNT